MGLRKITRVLGDLVEEVTSLADDNVDCVHATRLILYRASLDDKCISDELKKQAKQLKTRYDLADSLINIT